MGRCESNFECKGYCWLNVAGNPPISGLIADKCKGTLAEQKINDGFFNGLINKKEILAFYGYERGEKMNNASSEVFEIPKYTTHEISNLVSKQVHEFKGVEGLCKALNIDKQLVRVILSSPKVFSVEMYDIASKILNKSFDELTDFTEVVSANELEARLKDPMFSSRFVAHN